MCALLRSRSVSHSNGADIEKLQWVQFCSIFTVVTAGSAHRPVTVTEVLPVLKCNMRKEVRAVLVMADCR